MARRVSARALAYLTYCHCRTSSNSMNSSQRRSMILAMPQICPKVPFLAGHSISWPRHRTRFAKRTLTPHPHRSYVMQWNATVQRQISADFNVKIGYVGSRGVHQPFRVEDADIVVPILKSQGYLWPSPSGSGTRLNLNSGRITSAFWEGNSFYDALQVRVKKKIGRGLQMQGSYTWGKTIDTSSGSLVGDEYSNSIGSPLWFATKLNRGLADFNVAHNVEVNFTWELGTPKWTHGFG